MDMLASFGVGLITLCVGGLILMGLVRMLQIWSDSSWLRVVLDVVELSATIAACYLLGAMIRGKL